MLTIFSIPKPFRGHAGVIQRNALGSWARLAPKVEILLLGGEEGVADAAREAGARAVPDVARSPGGIPLLHDAFARAERLASHPLVAYVNADIVLFDDVLEAASRAFAWRRESLLVGQRRNLDVTAPLAFDDPSWAERLRARARAEGGAGGPWAIDWFVYPRGHLGALPPFAVGRMVYDNWILWRASTAGPVVDATPVVLAVHQNHDYGHATRADGAAAVTDRDVRESPEAAANRALVGGRWPWRRLHSLAAASHRLTPGGVRRNLTAAHARWLWKRTRRTVASAALACVGRDRRGTDRAL